MNKSDDNYSQLEESLRIVCGSQTRGAERVRLALSRAGLASWDSRNRDQAIFESHGLSTTTPHLHFRFAPTHAIKSSSQPDSELMPREPSNETRFAWNRDASRGVRETIQESFEAVLRADLSQFE